MFKCPAFKFPEFFTNLFTNYIHQNIHQFSVLLISTLFASFFFLLFSVFTFYTISKVGVQAVDLGFLFEHKHESCKWPSKHSACCIRSCCHVLTVGIVCIAIASSHEALHSVLSRVPFSPCLVFLQPYPVTSTCVETSSHIPSCLFKLNTIKVQCSI